MPPTSLRALWTVKTRSVFNLEKNDHQTLKDNMTHLSHRFSYHHLLNNVATVCTVIPAILVVIADAAAGILAAPAVPALITYTNEIKIIDIYSNKLLEISQKPALLTWGDGLFTNQTQSPQLIQELTQPDGHVTSAGRLTTSGKSIIQKQLHPKILAFQILTMLSDDARKVIKHQNDEYMWNDASGLNKKMDGMTITALILWRCWA
jgi:hypothetical protein